MDVLSDETFDKMFHEIHSNDNQETDTKQDNQQTDANTNPAVSRVQSSLNINWSEIAEQIQSHKLHFVKDLITAKEIEINSQNPSNGRTLLIYAVILGDLDLVQTICDFGADVAIKDDDEMDALDHAIKYGRYEITELVYFRSLSGSLGSDLKLISALIYSKNKEAQYMLENDAELCKKIIVFMTKAVRDRVSFDECLLYYAWYFVVHESTQSQVDPFEHELWRTMMRVYEEIISDTADKSGWKWLKQHFVGSYIWYRAHPNISAQAAAAAGGDKSASTSQRRGGKSRDHTSRADAEHFYQKYKNVARSRFLRKNDREKSFSKKKKQKSSRNDNYENVQSPKSGRQRVRDRDRDRERDRSTGGGDGDGGSKKERKHRLRNFVNGSSGHGGGGRHSSGKSKNKYMPALRKQKKKDSNAEDENPAAAAVDDDSKDESSNDVDAAAVDDIAENDTVDADAVGGGGHRSCYKCGEEGHISRDCPKGGGGGGGGRGGGDRSCYKCGEEGHISRDCPKGGGGDEVDEDQSVVGDVYENEMEDMLQSTLFYELLQRVRAESKKQSDMLLKEKVDAIKSDKQDEWQQLITYDVKSEYAERARQDLDFGDGAFCLRPKYDEAQLSEAKYPSSTHFTAKQHYDLNIYLNELLFRANILDAEFQHEMNAITKRINRESGTHAIYRAGPVKTLARAQTKVENDYIKEGYPTSAKILDINRCAIQCRSIEELMTFMRQFRGLIERKQAGCVKQVVRCKNGWSAYNEEYPSYTDVKFNVLIESASHHEQSQQMIIGEIQFLLELMSNFKMKAHKLYGVERRFEMVYNFGVLTKDMSEFRDNRATHGVFHDLVAKNDIKFFVAAWISNKPDLRSLLSNDPMAPMFDHALARVLIAENDEIHQYLVSNHRQVYADSIVFFINKLKKIKKWAFILDQFHRHGYNHVEKLRFVHRITDVFAAVSSQHRQIDNLGQALKALRTLNVLHCLLAPHKPEHSELTTLYLHEHKAFNYWTLNTPALTHLENDRVHRNTMFKFQIESDSLSCLYVFGDGKSRGVLGLGPDVPRCDTPTAVRGFEGKLCAISCGESHNLALDSNGAVYVWGESHVVWGNSRRNEQTNTPQKLPRFSRFKASHVAVGRQHSLILTEEGNVLSFGHPRMHQLGHGDNKEHVYEPKCIEALTTVCVVHIACGWFHNVAICSDGALFVWGRNKDGQCGSGEDTANKEIPTPRRLSIRSVDGADAVPVMAQCGASHTLVLCDDGTLTAFGSGYKGKLGHNSENNQFTPKVVDALVGQRVTDIAAGMHHSLCVTDQGELYAWGHASEGQLGRVKRGKQTVPEKVEFFAQKRIKIKNCRANSNRSAVITQANEIYMFGTAEKGLFGQALAEENVFTPLKIEFFADRQIDVALGVSHNAVIAVEEKSGDWKETEEILLAANERKLMRYSPQQNLTGKRIKIFVKNETLFCGPDWNFMGQYKYESMNGYAYSSTFLDNLNKCDDEIALINCHEIEERYHAEILQSTFVLLNENTPFVSSTLVNESQWKVFNNVENIRFSMKDMINLDQSAANCVSLYRQRANDNFFVLLKQFQ